MAAAVTGPLTWDKLLVVLEKMVAESASFTRHEIARKIEPWADRINELEQHALRDAGVWRQGHQYRRGHVCSDRGSLWICQEQTTSRPGTDKTWRLAFKNGHGA